ncbi:MAG: RES domain-containing protein [Actinomycetota bacterium]
MLATTFADTQLYRIGYPPNPWSFVPWEYAERSTGRWDDPRGQYRVCYAGSTPEACFVEVLAPFRADPGLVADTTAVASDPRDGIYPTVPAGTLPSSWLDHRRLGVADARGSFVEIGHKDTIAALRPTFLTRALGFGLPDFDAAAIRQHEPRELTRDISRHIYELDLDGSPYAGIMYASRFGDGLGLWAIFERAGDGDLEQSSLLDNIRGQAITPDNPDLAAALNLHGLALG